MKMKKYTIFSLAISALVLTALSFAAVEREDERFGEAQEEKMERESAGGYVTWRNQILNNQITGTVDAAEVVRINKEIEAQAALKKTNAGMDWIEVGPNNVGGRTRSILIDRNNSSVIYAGAVSGGIWKSTTAGASWTRVNDNMSSLNIGSLTQGADGSIYAGTGESFGNGGGNTAGSSGFDGTGVLKSTDGGVTFNLLPATDASLSGKSFWANTNDMKADPNIAGKIYACNSSGLYVTTDGGTTWARANTVPATTGNCVDIDMSPDGQTIAAVIGISIVVSTDGGVTFNRLNPATGSLGEWGGTPARISIAVAPSDNNYIYAMASRNTDSRLLSIVQSKDKGQHWTRIVTGSTPYVDVLGSDLQGQGWWNNVTSVDPSNPEHAYFGGIDLWDWTPTGGIKPISVWSNSITSPKYVHADNHAIVWDLKANPAIMYIGNDGGVFKSYDKGLNFASSNHGYCVTQFYAMSAAYVRDDVRNGWVAAGGTQDNGTWVVDGLGNTVMSGVKTKGGDGFHTELSQKLSGYGIFSTYDSELSSYLKFASRDNDFTQKYDQTFYNDRMAAYCKDSGQFNTPFTLWESTKTDSNSLFLFAARGTAWIAKNIYADLTKVPNWYRVAQISGNGSCVDISNDGNSLLIGTNSGVVYRVDSILTKGIFDSANATLSNVNVSVVFSSPGRFVTGVSFSKTTSSRAVITLGNYGNSNYLYYSTNLNSSTPTFASIQGNLPTIPLYDAEILWDDPNTLVVASERGMYVSKNLNSTTPTFALENSGMANVPVFQLRQYKYNNWPGSRFYIATHGRGMFVSTTYARTGMNAATKFEGTLNVYPNPAKTTTTLSFISKHSDKATISVYNLQGQLVINDEINTTSGKNNYSFYVNNLTNGNYIVIVNHDGIKETKKLVVVR